MSTRLKKEFSMTDNKPSIILIAGPYRSGTNDNPELMAKNLQRLEQASWPLFQAGYIPMIGEWVALPIWHTAGGKHIGDNLYEQILHPTATRLLQHCDAVLRLEGVSKGADNDVSIANERGIPVYYKLGDVPGVKV
jgi:hypothetical protein